MCYLIAKNNQGGSSLAIQMMHGKELAKLKQKLLSDLPGEEIQLLTVSRPSAYTEYGVISTGFIQIQNNLFWNIGRA